MRIILSLSKGGAALWRMHAWFLTIARVKGYMYILRCVDGSYYVGSTSNVDARLAMHQSGEGADWTSKRLPVALVFSEEFDSVFEAFQAERQVKGWSRDKKRALIRRDYEALVELSRNYAERFGADGPKE
jgi:putative endonuclease